MKMPLLTKTLTIALVVINIEIDILSESRKITKNDTIAYTYIITYYPDKKKNPLAGIGMTLMKYWIKGNKWRREEIYDDIRCITIVVGGWRYFLMPEKKSGTKTKVNQFKFPPDDHDPRTLLKKWLKKGAKKIGNERINGQECDVYEKHPSKPGEPKVKIWARKVDGIVIRVEEEGQIKIFLSEFVRVVHEFKDIKVGIPIDDSLFTVPRDYQLEEKS